MANFVFKINDFKLITSPNVTSIEIVAYLSSINGPFFSGSKLDIFSVVSNSGHLPPSPANYQSFFETLAREAIDNHYTLTGLAITEVGNTSVSVASSSIVPEQSAEGDGLGVGNLVVNAPNDTTVELSQAVVDVQHAVTIDVSDPADAEPTINIAATATSPDHSFSSGQDVVFATSGSLPTPLVAGQTYYAINVRTNTFEISDSPDGDPIETTVAGSGSHTVQDADGIKEDVSIIFGTVGWVINYDSITNMLNTIDFSLL